MDNFINLGGVLLPPNRGTSDNTDGQCENNERCKCCSGLCIDLLRKFEDELGFTYDLIRTDDPKWGILEVKP